MRLLVTLSVAILCACASQTRVTTAPKQNLETIRTIALAPQGGPLADAIGIELLGFGFQVFDTGHVSNLMVRMNVSEVEIFEPQNLRRLKTEGMDSVLQVRTVAYAGASHVLKSATVKLTSTETGMVLAGVSWDGKSGVAEAGKHIAKALGNALRPKAKESP